MARGVGVTVGGATLLSDVDLDVPAGQVHGLIGHNGSGKSTLLRVLARLQVPSQGSVAVGGRALAAWSNRAFAREVAFLPQATPATTGLTVRELAGFGRYPWHGPFGRVTAHDRDRIEHALRLARIEPLRDRLVDTLSGGERQRAWIAMLLAQDARFLLLDEPLSALDLAQQVEVLRALREIADRAGCAVVAILHDINMTARFCDAVTALRGGRVVARGTPAELMRPDTLELIHGVPMHVLPHPAGGHPIGIAR